MRSKVVSTLVAVGVIAVAAAGCSAGGGSSNSNKSALQQVQKKQANAQIYVPKNNPELDNYNLRTKMADNPANIIWCTFYPPSNGQEPFTVPFAGKLTSSNKRPFPDYHIGEYGDNSAPAAVPNPDVYGMFGTSTEYRFGFDPTRSIYSDFTNLPSYCTNKPTLYQQNKTTVVVQTSQTLNSLNTAAEAALKSGDAQGALKLLQKADTSGGK